MIFCPCRSTLACASDHAAPSYEFIGFISEGLGWLILCRMARAMFVSHIVKLNLRSIVLKMAKACWKICFDLETGDFGQFRTDFARLGTLKLLPGAPGT